MVPDKTHAHSFALSLAGCCQCVASSCPQTAGSTSSTHCKHQKQHLLLKFINQPTLGSKFSAEQKASLHRTRRSTCHNAPSMVSKSEHQAALMARPEQEAALHTSRRKERKKREKETKRTIYVHTEAEPPLKGCRSTPSRSRSTHAQLHVLCRRASAAWWSCLTSGCSCHRNQGAIKSKPSLVTASNASDDVASGSRLLQISVITLLSQQSN